MTCCQRDGHLQALLLQARAARFVGNVFFWSAHIFDGLADRWEKQRRDAILLRHPYLRVTGNY
jgi:hypothetical protein